jgi:hypothetical protein
MAQTVTLDYQNNQVSGTYTYLPTGMTATNAPDVPLPEASFSGSLTGSITYTAVYYPSNGFQNYIIDNAQFTLTGANGTPVTFEDLPQLGYFGNNTGPGQLDFFDVNNGGSLIVQTVDGVPDGATVDFRNYTYNASNSQLDIGASGVSASYLWQGGFGGECVNQLEPAHDPGGGFVYSGPEVPICTLTATSSSPGTWTAMTAIAPEIDPATAGSALTLLAGLAATVRARRRRAA